MRRFYYAATVFFILKVTAFAETNMTPVAVNGFNRDVVVQNTARPPFTNDAVEFAQGDGLAYYEKKLKGYTNGLPVSREFVNPADGAKFQFQPYTRKNVLALYANGTNTGTLTLPRRKFSRIAILANSGDGTADGTATVTLKFNDGSTYTTNYYAPDWLNNNSTTAYTVALQGVDTINLISGLASGGSAGNPRFYETTIPLYTLGSNKPLESLTFGMPASTKSTGIYAVSGLPSSSVGRPTMTMEPATIVNNSTAMLNGQVTRTGGETPIVTLFYGTKNGGTDAAHWSNSIALGYQTGAFSQTISSLSPATYYFTARAQNAGGAEWAKVQHFSTTGTTNDSPPSSSVAVLTQHNDINRSGDNLNETILNTSNVNENSFGLLYTRPVDDQIYAQPLIMTNVSIPGQGSHNLLIVATVNDSVYAYDADDSSVAQPYWKTSFISPPDVVPPNNTDESAIGACGGFYTDFSGNFGIVGTPVIDPANKTLYVVARTKEISGGTTTFVQRLHALNVATGAEQSNSPVVITATYHGTGDGGAVINFDPLRENQRPGLALANGIIYITWASHCDNGPYHGWVIGYNEKDLKQAVVWNDTPNGQEGGIWMSGQAPAADTDGNIYVVVGNGTVDTTTNNDYGQSFLKLTPANGTMEVTSYFIPYDFEYLNSVDLDLGCAGMLLIPGTTLAISGGKAGVMYLADRDSMGGLSPGDTDNVVESWSFEGDEIHGAPVWWSSANGSFIYVWPSYGDHLRQYQFNDGLFNLNAYAVSTTAGGSGIPGGILSVSANGSDPDTGILWATVNTSGDAGSGTVAGTLHAYSAQNVGQELWNSDMVSDRDSLGNLAKFVPPTIANGKVYAATFSDRVNVYGLLPQPLRTSSVLAKVDQVQAPQIKVYGHLPLPLKISFFGNNIILSWPTNGLDGYGPQYSTNFISGKWINMTNAPVRTNSEFHVTVPISEPVRYYRLNK